MVIWRAAGGGPGAAVDKGVVAGNGADYVVAVAVDVAVAAAAENEEEYPLEGDDEVARHLGRHWIGKHHWTHYHFEDD